MLSPVTPSIDPVTFHLAGVALVTGGIGLPVRIYPIGTITPVAGWITLVVAGASKEQKHGKKQRAHHKRYRYIAKHLHPPKPVIKRTPDILHRSTGVVGLSSKN